MYHSFVIAFSMFSKIPMPKCDWSKEHMNYSMCFLPWIGAVMGTLLFGWYQLAVFLGLTPWLRAALMVLIPFAVTGGIHMDGYLDTADAMASWQPRERRLEILKDSRTGAFAVMACTVYFLLLFAAETQVNGGSLPLLCCVFFLSRSLAAIGVVSLPMARKEGSVTTLNQGARKRIVQGTMGVYLVLLAVLMVWLGGILALVPLTAGVLTYGYYVWKCRKYFGGTTGDLSGYFITLCELICTLALVLGQALLVQLG